MLFIMAGSMFFDCSCKVKPILIIAISASSLLYSFNTAVELITFIAAAIRLI